MDGVTFFTHKSVGIRAVICDHTGRVEAALSKKLYAPLGPMEIEAKALEEGVNFAWDVGIRDLVVESDSQIVIDAFKGDGIAPMFIANIIEGTRFKLLEFRRILIYHVKRLGNRPAHILAQYAKNIDGHVTWIEENPNMIVSVLGQDVLNLSSS